jgi:hypothetical protein
MSKRTKTRRKAAKAVSLQPPASGLQPVMASAPTLFQQQSGGDGFRRLSASNSGRDLLPVAQDRMQQISFYLRATNPHARRIVETTKDYVVGEGLKIKCAEEAVQGVIDAFWRDPINNLRMRLHNYVADLGTFGELCLFAASNPINGRTRLGYVDVANIDSVEWGTLEGLPGIAVAQPISVVLRQQLGQPAKKLSIVHRDEDPNSETFGRLIGDCFYWAINCAGASTRGISDLFALADWIDGYDQMLYAVMGQVDALSRFIWDVTIQGATPEQIDDFMRKSGAAPKANSVRMHNEKVTWNAVAPSLNASDKAEAVRLIKLMILGGAGFPEHWFSDGSNANKATALAQGEPTLKMLTSRQQYVQGGIEQIAEFVIDRAVDTGVLPEQIDRSFEIECPDLDVRDTQKAATALQSAVQAMIQAQQVHAVDRETITRVIALLAQPMGLKIDVDAVIAAALAEEEQASLTDYTRQPFPEGGRQNAEGGGQPGAMA